MAYIGKTPTPAPLTATDIPDLPATKITSGTFPALNGSNLTNLDASDLTGTLPAISGANLTGVSAGKILQVTSIVEGATNQNIATTSYTDLTNMSINITPSATSSKILIVFAVYGRLQDAEGFGVRLERGSTSIYSNPSYSILADANPLHEQYIGATYHYIDSPNSTSQQTYKLGANTHDNNEVNFNASAKSYMYLMEIGA
tara:strand:+ start:522 stop:1124 length:603 start_codon:yes stop_codon:yes gene_type:complete